jgi:hypothetical protein
MLQQNPISKNNANTQTKTNTRKREKKKRDIEGCKNPREVASLTDERRETKMGT